MGKIKISKKILILIIAAVFILGISSFFVYKYVRSLQEKGTITQSSTGTSALSKPLEPPSETNSNGSSQESQPTETEESDTSQTSAKTPTATTYSIEIVGDAACQNDTAQALDLLKSRAETHYNVIIQYIGIIECINQGSGMWAWEEPPRYKVGDATRGGGTLWYAGTIAHDACHSKLYHDGKTWTGEQAEAECVNVQYDALEKMGAPQSTLDYVRNLISTEYWNIPYEDRWW